MERRPSRLANDQGSVVPTLARLWETVLWDSLLNDEDPARLIWGGRWLARQQWPIAFAQCIALAVGLQFTSIPGVRLELLLSIQIVRGVTGLLLRMLLTFLGLLGLVLVISFFLEVLFSMVGLRNLAMALFQLGVALYILSLELHFLAHVVLDVWKSLTNLLARLSHLNSSNTSDESSRSARLAAVIYVNVIHIYPDHFVRNHEDEMMLDFEERLDEHGQHLGWWFFTEIVKSLFGAVQAHLQRAFRRSGVR